MNRTTIFLGLVGVFALGLLLLRPWKERADPPRGDGGAFALDTRAESGRADPEDDVSSSPDDLASDRQEIESPADPLPVVRTGDEEGAPLHGVELWSVGEGSDQLLGRTDPAGLWTGSAPFELGTTIEARKEGLESARLVVEHPGRGPFEITLRRRWALAGMVLRHDGAPAAEGTWVLAYSAEDGAPSLRPRTRFGSSSVRGGTSWPWTSPAWERWRSSPKRSRTAPSE